MLSSINISKVKGLGTDGIYTILPKGLTVSMGRTEVLALLGGAQDVDEEGEMFRWDYEDKCMFVDF